MNIVLTGYRATGKTTIGKALAKRLHRDFIDSDDVIEERVSMPIREIFAKKGWQYFRKQEKKVIAELARLHHTVIAVGGGAFMYKANLVLTKNARIILLIAPLEVLSERMKNDVTRPPLTEAQSLIDEIREIWGRRKERYYKIADIVIKTTDGDVERAVDEIMEKLKLPESLVEA